MYRLFSPIVLLILVFVFSSNAIGAKPEPATPLPEAAVSLETPDSSDQDPNQFTRKGVKVEFSIEPDPALGKKSNTIREAEIAEIKFRITDAETEAPITPLEPAVWINLVKDSEQKGGGEKLSCKEQVGLYLQGMLGFQADIDLNKFYILVMNNDRTISVIDPILGVSGVTQLYALILLKEPGEDWVMSSDEAHLFVSMPKAGKVAVVDLENFAIIKNIEAGLNTVRVALQPDGKYLWVGNNGSIEGKTGVTVIDAHSLEVAAFIPTGAGHHEIAFSDDSLHAYVTNSKQNTLSVIDTQTLSKIKDLAIGKRPVAVRFSSLSRSAYVANEEEGTVAIVDGKTHEISKTLSMAPGLIALGFDPMGRWGFVANSLNNTVSIIDASNNLVAHNLTIGEQPHQIAFTDTYAYVRSLGTSEVNLVPLKQLGQQKTPAAQQIPLGSRPPGEYPLPSVADAISPTGEYFTVIATNPADRMLYYYMEGMIAPMGSYTTYNRIPRAVRVVDRSMREKEKGVYSAKLRIPKEGKYDVTFLIDSPWVYNCFEFDAEPNPTLTRHKKKIIPEIEVLSDRLSFPAGEDFKLRFSLKKKADAQLLSGLNDVSLIVTRPPGNWQDRLQASPLEDGTYEARITADRPGVYSVYFAVPSLKVDFRQLPYIFVTATQN